MCSRTRNVTSGLGIGHAGRASEKRGKGTSCKGTEANGVVSYLRGVVGECILSREGGERVEDENKREREGDGKSTLTVAAATLTDVSQETESLSIASYLIMVGTFKIISGAEETRVAGSTAHESNYTNKENVVERSRHRGREGSPRERGGRTSGAAIRVEADDRRRGHLDSGAGGHSRKGPHRRDFVQEAQGRPEGSRPNCRGWLLYPPIHAGSVGG